MSLRSALGAACLLAASCGGGGVRAPDLILVSVDTLRADRLPFYGADRDTGGDPAQPFTPSWLAAQGTVFETCWSTAGQTLPSLASFWTGLAPLEHGATSNSVPFLAPSRLEHLRAERFDVAHALLANASLAPGCGLERGFDTYGLMVRQDEARIPAAMLQRTQAAVQEGKRLLAWTHFMVPHQPYAPNEQLAKRYGPGLGVPASNKFLYDLHRAGSLDPTLRETVRSLYDAEIFQASAYVSEFLGGLDAQYRAAGRGGLLENAVVVFFSDHGEELADRHGYFMHAKSLHAGVIRVPLVVLGSGWNAGERRADALSLADVLPMVLDARAPAAGPFFAAWQAEFYAVRDERWTLVHNPAGNPNGPKEPPLDASYPYPVVGLYDRSVDPLELVNVAAEHPEDAARLLGALGSWYAGLTFVDSLAEIADPAVLAALGYTGSGAGVNPASRIAPLPAAPWPPTPAPR